MAPEFDFQKLTEEELYVVCNAGEKGVGYRPFQIASNLLASRQSPISAIRLNAENSKLWNVKISTLQVKKLNNLLNRFREKQASGDTLSKRGKL